MTTGSEGAMLRTVPWQPRESERHERVAHLVLIEDNPGDVELIRLALIEAGLHAQVHVAIDAHRARELMRDLAAPPALVLLDLNLPETTGDVLLRDLRADSPWRDVPVVVLTSSHLERDYERCFTWGASAYKVKPSTFNDYVAFAKSLCQYLG
jgi:two-component system response regulator